jgi:phasin
LGCWNCSANGDIGPTLRAPRQEIFNRRRPKDKYRMDKNIEITAPKPASVPMKDVSEAGSTKAKETFKKFEVATTEAADLIKSNCSKGVKGMQEYNNKIIEFAQANTNAGFDFVQKISSVKSPSEFLEIWKDHARKQVETLTEQGKQLAAIAQKLTPAAGELFKGVANPFSKAA